MSNILKSLLTNSKFTNIINPLVIEYLLHNMVKYVLP